MRPMLTTIAILVGVLLLLGGLYMYAANGPSSLRAEYRREVEALSTQPREPKLLQEADIAHLPDPVQRYIRQSGAIGEPRVHLVRARFRGRIRNDPESAWMPFTGEQHNVFDPPARLFYMDARMSGVPTQVLHRYVGASATMRVRVAGAIEVVNAAGAAMNRSETVTLLNDMAWLAPATLVREQISWEAVDAHTARATYRNAGQTVHATLFFNDAAELVNFTSDDRLRASGNGETFTAAVWSTPLAAYRRFGAARLSATGAAHWHEGETSFAYVEIELLDVSYNVSRP